MTEKAYIQKLLVEKIGGIMGDILREALEDNLLSKDDGNVVRLFDLLMGEDEFFDLLMGEDEFYELLGNMIQKYYSLFVGEKEGDEE